MKKYLWILIIIPLIPFAFHSIGGLVNYTTANFTERVVEIGNYRTTIQVFNFQFYLQEISQVIPDLINVPVNLKTPDMVPTEIPGNDILEYIKYIALIVPNAVIFATNWLLYIFNILLTYPKYLFVPYRLFTILLGVPDSDLGNVFAYIGGLKLDYLSYLV